MLAQIIRQGVGVRFEIQPAVIHDAEELFAPIQPVAAEHLATAQAIERGELFEDEITERVGGHKELPTGSVRISRIFLWAAAWLLSISGLGFNIAIKCGLKQSSQKIKFLTYFCWNALRISVGDEAMQFALFE